MLLTAPIRHHILAHSNHADAAALARLADRGPIDLTAAHPAADAGQALLLEQLTLDIVGRIAQDADHLELLTALDLGSVLVVPLAGRTSILGTITLARPPARPLYPRPTSPCPRTWPGGPPPPSSTPTEPTIPPTRTNPLAAARVRRTLSRRLPWRSIWLKKAPPASGTTSATARAPARPPRVPR